MSVHLLCSTPGNSPRPLPQGHLNRGNTLWAVQGRQGTASGHREPPGEGGSLCLNWPNRWRPRSPQVAQPPPPRPLFSTWAWGGGRGGRRGGVANGGAPPHNEGGGAIGAPCATGQRERERERESCHALLRWGGVCDAPPPPPGALSDPPVPQCPERPIRRGPWTRCLFWARATLSNPPTPSPRSLWPVGGWVVVGPIHNRPRLCPHSGVLRAADQDRCPPRPSFWCDGGGGADGGGAPLLLWAPHPPEVRQCIIDVVAYFMDLVQFGTLAGFAGAGASSFCDEPSLCPEVRPDTPIDQTQGREPGRMFALPQNRQATAELVQWRREGGTLSLTPVASTARYMMYRQCTKAWTSPRSTPCVTVAGGTPARHMPTGRQLRGLAPAPPRPRHPRVRRQPLNFRKAKSENIVRH